MLLGCYRSGDANDPDIYVRAVTSVLSEYPSEVIKDVCDPRIGLPAKSKWLPTVSEVKDACEAAMVPIDRKRREELALQERRRALSAPVEPRPTLEELKEKYGENWGIHGADDLNVVRDQRLAAMAHANEVSRVGEYERLGLEPVEAAPGLPVSLSLIRKLKGVR